MALMEYEPSGALTICYLCGTKRLMLQLVYEAVVSGCLLIADCAG